MDTKDSLGDRMKQYENISRIYLTRKMPIIIRLDGCHFHTFTKGMKRPFDDILIKAMQETAKYLCENISGCKLAYTQSDEISLLLTDYDKIETQPWFDNNLQKLVSVSASMATMAFTSAMRDKVEVPSQLQYATSPDEEAYFWTIYNKQLPWESATFDARAFILPKDEVCNYFIWRQQDASRNSIQMVGQANFSHKELQKKSCKDIQDMLMEKESLNWNDLETVYKRGSCIIKEKYNLELQLKTGEIKNVERSRWAVDKEIPIFTQDRNYVEQYII